MATTIPVPNIVHGARHSPGGPDPIPGIGGLTAAQTTKLNSQPYWVSWDGTGAQPARPVTSATERVIYISPVAPTGGGTIAGGTNAVNGLDMWFRRPA